MLQGHGSNSETNGEHTRPALSAGLGTHFESGKTNWMKRASYGVGEGWQRRNMEVQEVAHGGLMEGEGHGGSKSRCLNYSLFLEAYNSIVSVA